MSSSQNASHVQEENNSAGLKEKEKNSNLPEICTQKSISPHDLMLCPDTHENPSAPHSEVENLNKSPLNEESGNNDETFVSNMEESLGGKRDMSIEPNNANNDLELRHDDDFDDGNDIVNEDALLNEDEDLKDDIIKVQEEKDMMEIQNQDISLDEVEKNAKTKDIKDIPGETQKIYKDGDKHNDQNPLINVIKEPDNQGDEFLVKEECCEDFIAVDEIKEEDKLITNESKISTSSHYSSFEQITEHGLNKPDVMLEIPTQEFIEFSDEDDELGETSVQKSHDVEVIDLEKNCCIDNNLVNMNEKEIEATKNKSSVDIDMTVLADPKANMNISQAIVESSESCQDVNMEVADCQNDITTNALSYEAEIAADIITKEMNNVNVETFTQETELIQTENENSTEELINSRKSEPDKDVILVEAPDADIIVLSDDNIEIELEDSESSSAESLPDQNMKIQNSIKTVELDEDILNDTEEIDNLLLSRKLSKTKINEDNVKESDHLDKSCTKPCEKSISERNTVVNISETTDRLEISCQSANKIDTEPDKKVASETSSNMPINPAAKILDNITSDELTKEEGTAHDVSYQSAVTPDKMQITTPEIKVSQACISRKASPQLDSQFLSKIDFKLPQEIPSEPNMANIRLLGHSETSEQSSASEEESQVSKTPELVKSTMEHTVSIIDNLMSSSSNIDISKINENKSEVELSTDALKSSSAKLAGLTVKPFTSKDNKESVSTKEELMEVDIIEKLTPIKETETSETGEIQLSTSNIEPKISEIVEPNISTSKIESEASEIIELQLKLKAKLNNDEEIDRQQQSASKVELLTLEKDGPSLSTSKIEQQASEMDGLQKSTSKIASKTLQIIEQQPPTSKITSEILETTPSTSMIEPTTSEVVEPISNIKPATSEIVESTPSTSKIEPTVSETVVSIPSTSKIEPTIAVTVDPKPPTSNIELTTLEADASQKSSSEIVPKTQEPIKPKPSTSNIESETPESSEPQPSTSKCDAEALNSKPSSPKNQSAFDSLGQDSSNDVPEMTDSLGLLAESSRVMEDDEEHDEDDDDEDDDDGDRDDDDDDFEPDDESSNQMSAENSEDSNTQHSETDILKDDFEISESIDIKEEEPEKLVRDADEVKIDKSNIKTKKTMNDEALDNKDSVAKAMEIDTVKLSDTSDTEDSENKKGGSVLKSLLSNNAAKKSTNSDFIAKTKKLSITKQDSVVSYVDLEESSSDDDKTQPQTKVTTVETKESQQGTIADALPTDVPQINTEKLVKETQETSTSKSPQPAPEDVVKHKEPQVVAKSKLPSKAVVPDSRPPEIKVRSPLGLEVFSLDSDEEDSCVPQQTTDDAAVTTEPQIDKPTVTTAVTKELRTYKRTVTPAVTKEPQPDKSTVITTVTNEPGTEKPTVSTAVTKEPRKDQPKSRRSIKCINRSCANNDPSAGYYVADTSTAMYFEADKINKRAYVCKKCADTVERRNQELVGGMKDLKPLFRLHTVRNPEELVEISDSDSDEEPEPSPEQMQFVGNDGARMLEEKLADMINETWEKFKMDDRIIEAQTEFQKEIERMQKEGAKIEAMFNECQAETDKLRNSLYAAFDPQIQELPAVIIYDMPNCSYSCLEPPSNERVQTKRRLSPSKDALETPAKKPAIATPVPALPEDTATKVSVVQEATPVVEKVDDDNMDISVVTLAAEAAPADLPPPGDLSHPPIKLGMTVYAMKNAFGTWLRAKVVEIMPKAHNMPFTMVRVRFEHKVTKNPFKTLPARCLAYFEPSEVRMTIGTRVIALFKDISSRQAFYSGIVAEIPNPVNNYRYLIFFDDGYAQYAPHSQTRLVCEFSSLVWEEVHPYSREFVRGYLLAYPERPMVRLHAGQNLKTEWRGKWWSSRVVSVDSSLVEVQFLRCDRREWIYRGSTRLAPLYLELQAAERHRPRALPRAGPQARTNMPYVEYTRSDEQANKQRQQHLQQQQIEQEIRRQRAVAKKSTSVPPPPQPNTANLDHVTSRVVYYTPKNAVKPYKITPHTCSPKCKRTDVLALKDLRTYNPLAKPLLSGWERQIVRFKGHKEVMYVAPCGRRLRDVRELHRYLRAVDSDMPVDLFDFSPTTHCLAEFVLNKCFVGKKDLSHGKEMVPVPCVNYYDESLPEFCSYNTERTPTAGVPLNLDPEFLCGCDCDDDCEDKSKCACWQMTLEGARTIGYEGDVGYVYRRLPEPLPSGIYECNSRCKCKNTCLNRVAQHPLQLKLQVFKTHNRGWGIRALNDVPKGAFLCIYAGNLLTDATANLDGLNEGDEYLAELDYIEVVEQMKEGFEEDIPDKIKAKDKKELAKQAAGNDEDDDETSSSSEEETVVNKTEREDGDFEPGYIRHGLAEFSKRLRKRDSKKEAEDAKQQEPIKKETDDECITISDDEEVREPSCFTAAAGMGKNQFISKYRSVRTLFGEDEACYIMDAKVQGNIGRYLNHSCTPNVFVQNVFVDTHDPRFPWVAFFALHHIRAGTELTWNYNYDVGSVPGKVLYCFCGAPNCRGRLL